METQEAGDRDWETPTTNISDDKMRLSDWLRRRYDIVRPGSDAVLFMCRT